MTDHSAALLVATMDTKGREALFIADCIRKEGIPVLIMDAGIRGTCETPVDITRQQVAQAGGFPLKEVQNIILAETMMPGRPAAQPPLNGVFP